MKVIFISHVKTIHTTNLSYIGHSLKRRDQIWQVNWSTSNKPIFIFGLVFDIFSEHEMSTEKQRFIGEYSHITPLNFLPGILNDIARLHDFLYGQYAYICLCLFTNQGPSRGMNNYYKTITLITIPYHRCIMRYN